MEDTPKLTGMQEMSRMLDNLVELIEAARGTPQQSMALFGVRYAGNGFRLQAVASCIEAVAAAALYQPVVAVKHAGVALFATACLLWCGAMEASLEISPDGKPERGEAESRDAD